MVFWLIVFFFFFKQKTAYEMRISDWSSDVCSSDLSYVHSAVGGQVDRAGGDAGGHQAAAEGGDHRAVVRAQPRARDAERDAGQIGRASCRERVCQYV